MKKEQLLELRKKISAKRPNFVMQDHHKRKETQARWRKPKGMDSKMKKGVWGKPASVNPGYRGPKAVRGLQKGLVPVLVHNAEEAGKIEKGKEGAIMAHIGGRKKLEVLNTCKEKGIIVLNVKNIDEKIEQIKTAFGKQDKEKQEKKSEAKTEIKEEIKKTREEEVKEMEKILIRK